VTEAGHVSDPYPPIADYALIGDCHGTALISRSGSIDWCCIPRFDSDSCFGRLLDWNRGGFCSIAPTSPFSSTRRYLKDTLVLETTFETDDGILRVYDCFAMRAGGRQRPHRQILRIVECLRGRVELNITISIRFDFGELRPWLRQVDDATVVAVGSNDGLVMWSDAGLKSSNKHDISTTIEVGERERKRLSIQFDWPENLDRNSGRIPSPGVCDERLRQTIEWWKTWTSKAHITGDGRNDAIRSAIVLKALNYAPTGAIIAAPTTSLPETPGGERNWDYRYSWVRDSIFTVVSLSSLGFTAEADGFRRFIERSAAGSADDLQIMYRVDGSRRIAELTLKSLEGYRGARPVRIGNKAAHQVQLDVYGELLELAWLWQQRGHSPDEDYWRFLRELVGAAARRWTKPDHGFWEVRGKPQHFVHSKVMCWVALDHGIRLAEQLGLEAEVDDWKSTRANLAAEIETKGYDSHRGIYVRAFGASDLDAALLLLPRVGYIKYDDPRMVRTVDAIASELVEDGLVLRYRAEDGLRGKEGTFLACTFWLVECLARSGRKKEAQVFFDRAAATANDLGLFAEEFLVADGEMTGNFPQGLTHLSHISALAGLQ
jgi:GH15 family glucan-1,4-alpha-glucosidase